MSNKVEIVAVLRQALETLEALKDYGRILDQSRTQAAITSLRQAIANAESISEAEKQKADAVGFCEVLNMDDVADIIVNAQKRTPPYEINYMTVMQLTEKKVLEKFK